MTSAAEVRSAAGASKDNIKIYHTNHKNAMIHILLCHGVFNHSANQLKSKSRSGQSDAFTFQINIFTAGC